MVLATHECFADPVFHAFTDKFGAFSAISYGTTLQGLVPLMISKPLLFARPSLTLDAAFMTFFHLSRAESVWPYHEGPRPYLQGLHSVCRGLALLDQAQRRLRHCPRGMWKRVWLVFFSIKSLTKVFLFCSHCVIGLPSSGAISVPDHQERWNSHATRIGFPPRQQPAGREPGPPGYLLLWPVLAQHGRHGPDRLPCHGRVL